VKVGDLVRVKLSQSVGIVDGVGIITALKGREARLDRRDYEVFWVLINGRLSVYGSYQMKVIR
jgi:hypothetical protein